MDRTAANVLCRHGTARPRWAREPIPQRRRFAPNPGPLEAAYQDYTGSGAETAAHLRENGRIVGMFCAFQGSPKIVRLHGKGELIPPAHPRYREFERLFPANIGTRAYVHIRIERVSDSCGFSVPLYEFQAQRDTLNRWTASRTAEQLEAYWIAKNRYSIDGLAAPI